MVGLERQDIQGMVVSAYKHLPCAAYILLRVDSAAPARAWISQRVPEVTASAQKHPELSRNLAFTFSGLGKLGLKQEALDGFSFPFQEGMVAEYRSRLLGDTEENDPAGWDWGSKPENSVDVLLLLFGKDQPTVNTEVQRQTAAWA